MSHRNTSATALVMKLVLPPLGGGNEGQNLGGEFGGGGGVRLEEEKSGSSEKGE